MEALTLMQEEEHIVIEDGMSVWGQAAKRTFDCLLAAVLLIKLRPCVRLQKIMACQFV